MNVLHKSITDRQRFMSIPTTYFMFLAGFAYIATFVFFMPFLNILLIPLYIFARVSSKKDPYLLDILVDYFFRSNKYYA